MESGLAYAHKIKHQLPPGWVDWMREVIGKKAQDADRRALLQERWQEIKKAVNNLSLLIAPSRFLREMMLRSGMVNEDKIIHSDYGFEVEKFRAGFKALDSDSGIEKKSQKLRLGFIGTLVRHKGLHILIKAIREIQSANFELKIFGSENDFPGYVRELRRIAHKDPRIKWIGKIENDRIMDALSQIDVLVVPSLWYENSPLTIHEAFLAGIPVVVSNLGGMAELLGNGGGTSFRGAVPEDLAQKISDLIAHPEILDQWRKNIPRVKTIDQNYQELLALYQKVMSNFS
jgi:glycosyltransferase involved in cell wall biosynthesis